MIEIVDPKSEWSTEFARLAAVLRAGLGPLALRVDHIGSTAVPGLPAKDVIDVQIGVAELSVDVADAIARLGFVRFRHIDQDHVPPGHAHSENAASADGWKKFLFIEPSGDRRANIHVRRVGAPNFRFALLFRDYLIAHPSSAAAYAELKRRLASGLADPTSYPTVKDSAVDLIYFAAEAWAAAVGWEPAESRARRSGVAVGLRPRHQTLRIRLERAFALTADLVEHLEDAALGVDLPGLPSNRISGQMWCIVGARESYTAAIEAGEWRGFSCSLKAPDDQAAVLAALRSSAERLADIDFEPMSDRQIELAFDLLEHEIQHHGQLIRYVFGNGLSFPDSWRRRYTV